MESKPEQNKKTSSQPVEGKKPLPEKIDTIFWKEEKVADEKLIPKEKKEEPNTTEDKLGSVKSKETYNILALIPFKAEELDTIVNKIPSTNLRFVHFYSGMKLAMNEFNSTSEKLIHFNVMDTRDPDITKEILSNPKMQVPDIIIGPYKIESIKYASEWAKKNKSFLLSPWISSSSIAESNPYYVQIKAGLSTHYQLLNQHARANFSLDHIVLIAKSKEESKANLFNDSLTYQGRIREEVITEEELSKSLEPILENVFKADGPTVFILPLNSVKDENYIYHFLRRVISEKKNKTVYIYGMPKWLEMKSEILEFINTMNVRISISNFVDESKPDIIHFRKKYFQEYREFPSANALEGYDLAKFIILSLRKYGSQFIVNDGNIGSDYLQTDFHLSPVSKANNKGEVDYYENQYVKLIEIKNNRYKVIN